MTKTEQLDWEARAGRAAGIAAILAAVCLIGATVYLQASIADRPDNTDELFEVVDSEKAAFIGSGVIQGIGLLMLIPVLGYLYRVTKYRRPQLIRVALVLAIAGPVTAAILGVLRQVELVSIAGDFLDLEPRPRIGTQAAEDRAEDLIDDSSLPVISGVGFAANLSLGFAVVLLALNAMRAGLTSRFLGIIGIIIGVLYVLPVAGGPQIVQLFWLGALATLFIGKWPGGRGPAWETGEATPWPSARELAERREELGIPFGDGNGRAPGAEEPASADPDTPRQDPKPSSRKRKKRKKR